MNYINHCLHANLLNVNIHLILIRGASSLFLNCISNHSLRLLLPLIKYLILVESQDRDILHSTFLPTFTESLLIQFATRTIYCLSQVLFFLWWWGDKFMEE